jgi:quinol monooxygenase YgiN
MTVLVTIKVPGDTQKFMEFVDTRREEMDQLTEESRRRGCLAHRFAVGDGYVLVVDEWESPEQFREFFQLPQIAEVMPQMGAQGEPEITIAQAIDATRF